MSSTKLSMQGPYSYTSTASDDVVVVTYEPYRSRHGHMQARLGFLNYGRVEDPAKSMYSIMAFVERGLGAKSRAHANSTVSKHEAGNRSSTSHVAQQAAHAERAAAVGAVARTLQVQKRMNW